jgi:hypothetical protein
LLCRCSETECRSLTAERFNHRAERTVGGRLEGWWVALLLRPFFVLRWWHEFKLNREANSMITHERAVVSAVEVLEWALSCRKSNTDEWMEGLVVRINAYLSTTDQPERFKYDGCDRIVREQQPESGSPKGNRI